MMRLVQLRIDAGMSRGALADAAGITYQALSSIEKRETLGPQAQTLHKLALALTAKTGAHIRASELLQDAPTHSADVAA